MSKAEKTYAIARMNDRIYSFLLDQQKAVEIHCDGGREESLIGNIYVGKIKNIAKNIGAAFVEIAPGVSVTWRLRRPGLRFIQRRAAPASRRPVMSCWCRSPGTV